MVRKGNLVSVPTYKDGPLGLFQQSARPVSVPPLGDAHRGAHSWPSAAVSNLGEPAATTPRAAGSAFSGGGLSGTPFVAGVRCSFRGKDAGSADSRSYRRD